ncbi:PAS domain-containing protein [Amantichitinum ursilacus]|uniref:PAS domain-containing protein n=1 Tax=Amantichitinum ursilacus TaxID=857265 RepID=UPI00128EBD4A|nr:PAS domain-containing protein [Amantichitinum ursilacus]
MRQFAAFGEGDVFYAVLQKTRVPMVMADARSDGHPLVFANAAFAHLTGYSVDEVMGRNCNFLQGEATRADTVLQVRDALDWPREIAVELLNYRKDGSAFWNALFISPVFDPDGELRYFLGSQRDVTQRHAAAEALRHARDAGSDGHISSEAAHDFNNLLQVMLGQLGLLTRSLQKTPVPGAKAQHHLQAVRMAVEQAGMLSNQLQAAAQQARHRRS